MNRWATDLFQPPLMLKDFFVFWVYRIRRFLAVILIWWFGMSRKDRQINCTPLIDTVFSHSVVYHTSFAV